MDTEATAAQADVPELDLVKQAQGGDTEAFDQLVGRYRTRVFAMIYNMGKTAPAWPANDERRGETKLLRGTWELD